MTTHLMLRIQSDGLSIDEITSLVGVAPTGFKQPMDPAGSSWAFEVSAKAEDDPIGPAFDKLEPLLERLGELAAAEDSRELELELFARNMGNWYQIEPNEVGLISRAGGGIVLVTYNGPDTELAAGRRAQSGALDAVVSLSLQSEYQTAEQLTELVGAEPTDVGRKDLPVSSSDPEGVKRKWTSWSFGVEERADDPLPPGFERLRPLLWRLGEVEPRDESRYVVLMLDGRDTGARHTIAAGDVSLMARARAGLAIDVYNESEQE